MDFNIGNPLHIFFPGKDHVLLASQKTVNAMERDKFRRDGNAFMGALEFLDGLGQEINGGAEGQSDGKPQMVTPAVVLALLDGAFHFFPDAAEHETELLPCRCKRRAFSGTVEDGKPDFFFHRFNMICQCGLGDVQVFRRTVEVQ